MPDGLQSTTKYCTTLLDGDTEPDANGAPGTSPLDTRCGTTSSALTLRHSFASELAIDMRSHDGVAAPSDSLLSPVGESGTPASCLPKSASRNA